jgi:hypothetical protein
MKWFAAVIAVLALALAGCGGPEPRPRTVNDLAQEPAVLQGLAARCAANKHAAANDPECINARIATERLGKADDAKRDPDKDAEFERLREQRRQREDAKQRAAAQAEPKFDPYSSPVSVEPPANAPKL